MVPYCLSPYLFICKMGIKYLLLCDITLRIWKKKKRHKQNSKLTDTENWLVVVIGRVWVSKIGEGGQNVIKLVSYGD